MDLMWTCLDRANFLFGFQRGKVEMKGTGAPPFKFAVFGLLCWL